MQSAGTPQSQASFILQTVSNTLPRIIVRQIVAVNLQSLEIENDFYFCHYACGIFAQLLSTG